MLRTHVTAAAAAIPSSAKYICAASLGARPYGAARYMQRINALRPSITAARGVCYRDARASSLR